MSASLSNPLPTLYGHLNPGQKADLYLAARDHYYRSIGKSPDQSLREFLGDHGMTENQALLDGAPRAMGAALSQLGLEIAEDPAAIKAVEQRLDAEKNYERGQLVRGDLKGYAAVRARIGTGIELDDPEAAAWDTLDYITGRRQDLTPVRAGSPAALARAQMEKRLKTFDFANASEDDEDRLVMAISVSAANEHSRRSAPHKLSDEGPRISEKGTHYEDDWKHDLKKLFHSGGMAQASTLWMLERLNDARQKENQGKAPGSQAPLIGLRSARPERAFDTARQRLAVEMGGPKPPRVPAIQQALTPADKDRAETFSKALLSALREGDGSVDFAALMKKPNGEPLEVTDPEYRVLKYVRSSIAEFGEGKAAKSLHGLNPEHRNQENRFNALVKNSMRGFERIPGRETVDPDVMDPAFWGRMRQAVQDRRLVPPSAGGPIPNEAKPLSSSVSLMLMSPAANAEHVLEVYDALFVRKLSGEALRNALSKDMHHDLIASRSLKDADIKVGAFMLGMQAVRDPRALTLAEEAGGPPGTSKDVRPFLQACRILSEQLAPSDSMTDANKAAWQTVGAILGQTSKTNPVVAGSPADRAQAEILRQTKEGGVNLAAMKDHELKAFVGGIVLRSSVPAPGSSGVFSMSAVELDRLGKQRSALGPQASGLAEEGLKALRDDAAKRGMPLAFRAPARDEEIASARAAWQAQRTPQGKAISPASSPFVSTKHPLEEARSAAKETALYLAGQREKPPAFHQTDAEGKAVPLPPHVGAAIKSVLDYADENPREFTRAEFGRAPSKMWSGAFHKMVDGAAHRAAAQSSSPVQPKSLEEAAKQGRQKIEGTDRGLGFLRRIVASRHHEPFGQPASLAQRITAPFSARAPAPAPDQTPVQIQVASFVR